MTLITFGIDPSWSGIVTAWAIVSPVAPQRAAEKSMASSDDRGVGGAEDGRRHLVGDRGQAVGDDLACNRIGSRLPNLNRVGGARVPVESERSTLVEPHLPVRGNHDRGVVLVDQERPGDRIGADRATTANRRIDCLVHLAEVDRARSLGLVVPPARGFRGRQGIPARPYQREADRPDLDRGALLEPGAVESFVLRLESFDELIDRCRFDRGREFHVDAPVLAPVANIGRPEPYARLGPGTHPVLEMLTHVGVESTESSKVRLASVDSAKPHVVKLGAREEQAGRRKEARERGDDGCLDTQFRGERCPRGSGPEPP